MKPSANTFAAKYMRAMRKKNAVGNISFVAQFTENTSERKGEAMSSAHLLRWHFYLYLRPVIFFQYAPLAIYIFFYFSSTISNKGRHQLPLSDYRNEFA